MAWGSPSTENLEPDQRQRRAEDGVSVEVLGGVEPELELLLPVALPQLGEHPGGRRMLQWRCSGHSWSPDHRVHRLLLLHRRLPHRLCGQTHAQTLSAARTIHFDENTRQRPKPDLAGGRGVGGGMGDVATNIPLGFLVEAPVFVGKPRFHGGATGVVVRALRFRFPGFSCGKFLSFAIATGTGKMSSRANRTVYVGNLPGDIREREVEDLFCKYGPIVDIDLKIPPRPPGYAFVEVILKMLVMLRMLSVAEMVIVLTIINFGLSLHMVDEVIHHQLIDIVVTVVEVALVDLPGVLVTGLPSSASWQDLKDHMRRAGDVCFSQVFRDGRGKYS
ncbi:hypothetical protein Taro_027020 [Colocasia esculenta]|uniref:RRM domain-containing protein n=1 Tax=Colocasia esculenta TaxID=4460 RepID=A0A843VT34_COLES|nr:hypothetical protein [Colocasia esculenta]